MPAGTELLESLPIAVYVTDVDGHITYYNEAAAELWGHRPEFGSTRWTGWWRLFWPDGRPMRNEDCPMAVTLREGRPVRGVEAIAERPDGRRVHFLPHPSLLRDGTGRVTGAINVLADLTDRRNAEIDSARLAAIVASSDDAIIGKTLEGVVTSWNAGATRIFGYEPEEMVGQSIIRIIPTELRSEEDEILSRIRRGERIEHFDTVRVRKDGRRIDISLTVSPIRNSRGEVVGASKIARDVTERKQSEELQRILLGELNHRVKNTLAIIQAIARQSLRVAPDPDLFVESFTGRVQAFSRAHDLLVQRRMKGADLADLVREQVDLGTADPRIASSGPMVTLDPRTAVQMALVLHELGTNARKYGALSTPTGRLAIGWTTTRAKDRELRLEWKESGVPAVSTPVQGGFGINLIERTLQANQGDATLHFLADGLLCELRLPLTDAAGNFAGLVAAAEAGGEPRPERSGAVELQGRRVLVVEDEPLIAMEIEENLSASGCDVVGPAPTVGAARRLIESSRLDAALVDANLAGTAVDDVCADLTRGGVPFAFCTGYGREGLPAGYDDAPVLAKPFGPDQLLEMVRRLLAGRSFPDDVIPLRGGRP
jgi:PAS domain S-box-containing protein